MKRDKEWFIKELLDHENGDYGNSYNSGYEDGLAYALKLARQLDEPEKVIIPQFVADWICQAKKWEYSISDSMEHVGSYFGTTQYDKAVYWANKNQDIFTRAWFDGYEIEKVVIPQFVAAFIEDSRNKVGCIVTAIWEMYEYEYKHVYEWSLEDGNDELLMKAFANGYEIEKEKLYYISFPKLDFGCIKMWRNTDTGSYYFAKSSSVTSQDGYKCVFTEKEIKEHDERFWPFAVEVSE